MAVDRKVSGVVVLLVLGIAAALLAWSLAADGTDAPVAPLSTSAGAQVVDDKQDGEPDGAAGAQAQAGGSNGSDVVPAAGEAGSTGVLDASAPASDRIAIAGRGAPCQLLVRVHEVRSGRRIPQAFSEVHVACRDVDDSIARGAAMTGADGLATFTLTGGAQGRRFTVLTASGAREAGVIGNEPVTEISIELAPTTIVTGRAVDVGGRGVADADLLLIEHTGAFGGRALPWQLGRSGADGSFSIGLLRGGSLGALHPDYAPSTMEDVGEGSTTRPHSERMRLVLGVVAGPVDGSVFDHDGAPVRGALVELRCGERAPLRARSDERGAFHVQNVAPGAIVWCVSDPNHGWQHGQLRRDERRLDVRLLKPAKIIGEVRSPSGTAVAGAVVCAYAVDAPRGSPCVSRTRSLPDGSFVLAGVGPGLVHMTAHHTGLGASREAMLQAGGVDRWQVVLGDGSAAAMLSGTVVDGDGEPQVGWNVIVHAGERSAVQIPTDERGVFRVPAPRPTGLDVRVLPPGSEPTDFAAAVAHDVDVAAGPLRLVVRDFATTTVRGRVLASAPTEELATIDCLHQQQRQVATFTAAPDGSFVLERVPVGTVMLRVRLAGHADHRVDDVELQAGVPKELPPISLSVGAAVHGSVYGPDGQPPTGECVLQMLFDDKRETPRVLSPVGGAYRFDGLPAGKMTLLVQGEGFASTRFEFDVPPGAELPRDIELQLGVTRTVHVHVPAEGGDVVTLWLRAPGDGASFRASGDVARTDTSATGVATFEACMAPGTYELFARTDARLSAQQRATFAVGDTAELELTVAHR